MTSRASTNVAIPNPHDPGLGARIPAKRPLTSGESSKRGMAPVIEVCCWTCQQVELPSVTANVKSRRIPPIANNGLAEFKLNRCPDLRDRARNSPLQQ